MSHINEAFKNGKALIAFLTTGTPSIEDTVRYVLDMEKAGATLIELGVPFSDPIADGPVIMEADVKALKNGIHLPQVMETVKEIRKHTAIPIVLLTYYNPVFRYPADRFFQEAKEIGIDGVIIPDLPGEEQQEIRPLADENGVDIIQMVAPTSEDRIRSNVKNATGFVYVVSSMGVTGMRGSIQTDLKDIIQVIKETTDTPVAIGFGIHTPKQAKEMAALADGVITGSGVVDIINKEGNKADQDLMDYIGGLKKAIGISIYGAMGIADKIIDVYNKDKIDRVELFYTDCVSPLLQEEKHIKLIPLDIEVDKTNISLTNYEPSAEEVFDSLIPKYIAGVLFGAIVDSFAAEQAARRTAMENATDNANEMISNLSLVYNRARQAAITQEITEIVSGANAQE